MASDNYKVKGYEKSDWLKHAKYDLTCSLIGSETVMKYSSKQLESPPPKPPRRRYSDQLSGTYTSGKKHNEENQTINPKLKTPCPKPAYLSLPTNLTSNLLAESNDSSVLFSHSVNRSDHLNYANDNHIQGKNIIDSPKFSDNGLTQTYDCNGFNCSEPQKYQGINCDPMFIKLQCENSEPYSTDKLSRSFLNINKTFMTNKLMNQDFNKSLYKDCHRRHHSDPVISHFSLLNDCNKPKSDEEQCYNSICLSTRKANKCCESTNTCACCKRSYLILQEIRLLKDINEKLWQRICSLQSHVENMRKTKYDDCDVSVSGLLSSVYYAQRAKDSAMEERLKIALEERNAALLQLDDLIKFMTKSFDCAGEEKGVEKNIKELLSEIGCTLNPSKLLKHQRMILAQIHNLKDSKQDCLARELKHLVAERDNALEKVKKLEEEVRDLKLTYDLWLSDNKHWESTIFDILNQLIHQRDTVLSKIDNGLDINNILYRSPIASKLESMEYQNASHFEACSKTIESIKVHPSIHLSDYKQKHSYSASDEVVELKEEILLLNKTLESEMKKREHAEGKCIRLERLIHILRKKLNGQNIGVPV